MPTKKSRAEYMAEYRRKKALGGAEPGTSPLEELKETLPDDHSLPTWQELCRVRPGSLAEAILEGAAKCSPEPLQKWRETHPPQKGWPTLGQLAEQLKAVERAAKAVPKK